MAKKLAGLLLLLFAPLALAQSPGVGLDSLPSASALTGSELIFAYQAGSGGSGSTICARGWCPVSITPAQIQTYVFDGYGYLPVVLGGTGLTAVPTNGQLLIGNGSGYTLSTLTAGSNVTITNGAGTITIAASGGGGSLPSCTTNQLIYYASNGTTGTCLALGTNLSISSATLNASGSGMTWPAAAGIPNYSGSSSWGTSYSASNTIPADFLAATVAQLNVAQTFSATQELTNNKYLQFQNASGNPDGEITENTSNQLNIFSGAGGWGVYSGGGASLLDYNESNSGAFTFSQPLYFTDIASGTLTDCLGLTSADKVATGSCVNSFTGDGVLLNNSASTGAVTATLASTGVGYGVFGNTGSSSAAPSYHALSSYPIAAFPTLNQNTTGTAANLSGTPALPNGTTATTQSTGDDTTKLATDAFVLANAASAGVSSAAAGPGIAITGTGSGPYTGAITVSASYSLRAVSSGTTDTILSTDCANGVNYTSTSAVAISLPQATSSFAACSVDLLNNSGQTETVTTTTSTINGASSLSLAAGTSVNITALSGNYIAAGTGVGGTRVYTLASGFQALGTSAIASGACATTIQVAVTAGSISDTANITFTTDPNTVTGYKASASGALYVNAFMTSGELNIENCNNTASSITPGAISVHYNVTSP